MLNSIKALGFIAVLLVLATSSFAQETPLNVLFFGNSFTMYNNLTSRFVDIARADGHVAPVVVADLSGGTDLDYHLSQVTGNPNANVTSSTLPSGDTWDYVVMQGYSTEATHIRNPEFEQDALALYQAVEGHSSANAAGVTGVLYQTWARPNLVPGTFSTLTAMQTEITAGYQAAYDLITATEGQGSVYIGTVGQAFELDGFDDSLYASDDYHPSAKGTTLAALVLYRTIYDENVSDIDYATASSYFGDISQSDWLEITGVADAAPIVTPEPASLGLLLAGGIGLLRRKRRGKPVA